MWIISQYNWKKRNKSVLSDWGVKTCPQVTTRPQQASQNNQGFHSTAEQIRRVENRETTDHQEDGGKNILSKGPKARLQGRSAQYASGIESGEDKLGSPSERFGRDTADSGSHRGLLCRGVTGRKWCFGHTPHIVRCQTCIQRND